MNVNWFWWHNRPLLQDYQLPRSHTLWGAIGATESNEEIISSILLSYTRRQHMLKSKMLSAFTPPAFGNHLIGTDDLQWSCVLLTCAWTLLYSSVFDCYTINFVWHLSWNEVTIPSWSESPWKLFVMVCLWGFIHTYRSNVGVIHCLGLDLCKYFSLILDFFLKQHLPSFALFLLSFRSLPLFLLALHLYYCLICVH